MILKMFILSFVVLLISCSSDDIVKREKKEFWGIYRALAKKSFEAVPAESRPLKGIEKTRGWLSKFNQPIILISSTDFKNQATLIALGNNNEKLTWVSADGMSLTYDQGILIATRGYSQDLYSLKYKNPEDLFKSATSLYNKVHRYLNSENRYNDMTFRCEGKKIPSKTIQILELELPIDRVIEECENEHHSYKNVYDLLAGTTIVIVSKQWISPSNQYFLTYNMYAFQKT